jgi:xanthine dehydrogenase molybdenum-binding subunit
MNILMSDPSQFKVIGKALPRVDSFEKVTGEALYLEDVVIPGLLVGKILRSPHPHARILRIDTSKALKVRGVKVVVTAADTPRKKFSASPIADKLPLEDQKVRYIGDEVAAIAAIDDDAALEGLSRIKVEYESLPPVFDPLEALNQEGLLIHEGKEKNIAFHFVRHFGDIEKGFAESDHIFEDSFTTHVQAHGCLETYGAIASFDIQGKCKVWIPTQTPHPTRLEISRTLDIPLSQIQVTRVHVGGAFGRTLGMSPIVPICVVLAKKAGQPVKIVNTREEEFKTTRQRHPFIVRLKTGLKSDGRLWAREARMIVDNGAYNCHGPRITSGAAGKFTTLYGKCPNLKVEGILVYTNKNYGGAFRGYGNPQITFAVESQIDMIARRLDMTPKELRLLNADTANMTTTCGAKITSCALKECIEQATAAIEGRKEEGSGEIRQGIGLATMIHSAAGSKGAFVNFNVSEAFLKMDLDGAATLFTGASETGQGSLTALAQIVAETLGLPLGKIRVVASDTDLTPFDLGAYACRTTFMAGNAVKRASDEIREQLVKVASEALEANPADVRMREGRAFVIGAPHRNILVENLVPLAYGKGVPLVSKGVFVSDQPPVDPKTGYGNYTLSYSFAAHAVKIEVHLKTGRVKVLEYAAAHDVGRIINKLTAEGQVEGAIMQGIGYALTENIGFEKGVIKNADFFNYRIPTALDIPRMRVMLIESVDPLGPFGAKGLGEPGLVPVAAALTNAIDDAVGVRITDLPITPEKILNGLRAKDRFKMKGSGSGR